MAYLGSLNLEHLLVFLGVALNWLVEEEVGHAHTDAVTSLAIGGKDLLQFLEDAVRGHAPGLGESERDFVCVAAADSGRPLPATDSVIRKCDSRSVGRVALTEHQRFGR